MKQMKKILSVALALVMTLVLVPTMSAEAADATTMADITDGNTWWAGHGPGVAIEDGKDYSFTWDVVYTGTAETPNNWNGTNLVIYGGDEGKVNGAGYIEYWVGRQDVHGWIGANSGTTTTEEYLKEDGSIDCWVNGSVDSWENFQAALKTGTTGKLDVSRSGQTITYTMQVAECKYTFPVVLPESATQTIYLSLFTDCAKMTNISYTEEWQWGTSERPWELSTTTTRFAVYVPAGATQWVQVDNSNGTTLNVNYVNDEAAAYNYMIMYGRLNQYTPEAGAEGLLNFTMQEGGDMFSIYNAGTTPLTLYMSLTEGAPADTTGTMDDPEVLTLQQNMFGGIGAQGQAELEAGNEGYWYTVTAPSAGKLTVSVSAIDAEWNFIGWMYNVQNVTAGKYGDNHVSDDAEPVLYEEWTVAEGDVLKIFAATYDPADTWNNPAGTVNVEVNFAPIGSYNNPLEIEEGTYTSTFEVANNVAGYYYTYIATEDGDLVITIAGDTWQYWVNNETAEKYGETYTYSDETVLSSQTLTVATGDEITIFVATCDSEQPWLQPAGSVTLTVAYDVEEPETETETETESESNTEDNEENIPSKGDLVGTMGIMVVLMGAALVLVAIVSRKKVA